MTSSNWKHALTALTLLIPLQAAWASLGDAAVTIEADRVRMHARRAQVAQPGFTVHELTTTNGSHIRQFVGSQGEVFAVTWVAQHKPDLSALLGSSFASYKQAIRMSASRGGIQRHFRHADGDLIVQSRGHLHLYSGYAMRRSLVPAQFVPQTYGIE
jgi:hypothetical protein